MNVSSNNEIAEDPESNSVYFSAASSSDGNDINEPYQPEEEGEVVMAEVNFAGREHRPRHEYRRRLTLDPLTDFIINGDTLLEEAGSEDTSGDEQQYNMLPNQREPNIERDAAVRQQLLLLLGHDMMDDDGDSSSSGDGNNHQNQNNNEDVSHLLARDHAYLPTAQPLYPEEWIPAGRNRNRVHRISGSFDAETNRYESSNGNNLIFNTTGAKSEAQISSIHYEITEPPDAHNFAPTQRSLHPSQVELDEQPAKAILAIMEVSDVILFPGSVIPLRVRDPVWVNYVGALIDDARGLYGSHSGSTGGMGEVKIGILPRISHRRRTRRQSSISTSETASVRTGGRMGRWRIDLIRRGVAAIRRPGRRRRIDDDRDRMSTDGDENGVESNRGSDREPLERQGESEEEESSEDEYFHPATTPSPSNPFVGRIGTMATITFTHEEAAIPDSHINEAEEIPGSAYQQERSRSMVWQRHRGEIVISALGTNRFRITAPVEVDANLAHRDRRYDGILFEVEEMNDFGVSMPPSWILRSPGDFRYPLVTQTSHANAIWYLAQRSSIPAPAYQSVWPWRVAQKICNLIQDTDQYKGIKQILPTAGGLVELKDLLPGATTSILFRVVDPSAFADWLSSNLPLSQNERLDLLEMESRSSQLKYLLKKVEKDRETILRCKCCAAPLSSLRHVFTVKGAAGTTGNYVNEVCLMNCERC
jgi:hypothetical protein